MSAVRSVTVTLRYLFCVNCYLLSVDDGFVLIDTGVSTRREALESQLRRAGCEPGALKLIVVTHAHTDHAGNCAYLRRAWGAPIAMHAGDLGKAARGDMFWRADGRRGVAVALAGTALRAVRLARFDPFAPDVLLVDGQRLDEYGLAAEVLHVPGHTQGSIALLTKYGDLYCGDLFTNTKTPEPNSMLEDAAAQRASVTRVRGLPIATVYPGHGRPFAANRTPGRDAVPARSAARFRLRLSRPGCAAEP